MATPAELAGAVADLDAIRAKVASISTADEMQAELDSVNARLEQERNEKTIALTIIEDETLTDAEKLEAIAETLGLQS